MACKWHVINQYITVLIKHIELVERLIGMESFHQHFHADDAALLDTALIFSRSLILGAATDFKKNNYN